MRWSVQVPQMLSELVGTVVRRPQPVGSADGNVVGAFIFRTFPTKGLLHRHLSSLRSASFNPGLRVPMSAAPHSSTPPAFDTYSQSAFMFAVGRVVTHRALLS
jgi:hypothetical protein